MIRLLHGDCLDLLKQLPKNSIDLILADPPYGTTYCKWDIIIEFEPLWKELRRVAKEDTAIVIFGTEPFSSLLRASNIRMYKYDWLWEKDRSGNFGAAKYQPINYFENISVFYKRAKYYPIMEKRVGRIRDRRRDKSINKNQNPNLASAAGAMNHGYSKDYDPTKAYPKRVLKYKKEIGLHEAQKPVPLLEYLIKTYTKEHEIILDFSMGSGSTGVAAVNQNRGFIGMELDRTIYNNAVGRLASLTPTKQQLICIP